MKAFIVCFVFTLGLIGCGPISSSSGKAGGATEQATAIQGSPFPSIIPTPMASKGTVIGRLVSATPGSLTGIAFYFGALLPLTPGPGHLVTMDLANSPKVYIRDDGRFMAENITPGEYVLILWTPHQSRYVTDPKNPDQDFIVEIVAGQVVDVGTLQAPSLP